MFTEGESKMLVTKGELLTKGESKQYVCMAYGRQICIVHITWIINIMDTAQITHITYVQVRV